MTTRGGRGTGTGGGSSHCPGQLLGITLNPARPADVLLLDEFERHLDTDRVGLVVTLLAERADRGTALLAATHDSTVVDACDGDIDGQGRGSFRRPW